MSQGPRQACRTPPIHERGEDTFRTRGRIMSRVDIRCSVQLGGRAFEIHLPHLLINDNPEGECPIGLAVLWTPEDSDDFSSRIRCLLLRPGPYGLGIRHSTVYRQHGCITFSVRKRRDCSIGVKIVPFVDSGSGHRYPLWQPPPLDRSVRYRGGAIRVVRLHCLSARARGCECKHTQVAESHGRDSGAIAQPPHAPHLARRGNR